MPSPPAPSRAAPDKPSLVLWRRPRRSVSRPRACLFAPAAALLALAGLPAPAALAARSAPLNVFQPVAEEPPESADHLTTLRDGSAERAARDAAADALIRLAHRPAVAQTLSDVLLSDDQSDARNFLLRAIARTWNPPGRLYRPLIDLAARSEPQRAASVMQAIAAYGSRDAAQVLIDYLQPNHPGSVRDAAASALFRMTGRDDLRSDPQAWAQWLSASKGLSDPEWRDLLAEGVWRRAERLESDRRVLGERLSEGYRRLYISTPVEERPRLLSQLMLDARPELRDVGMEIVSRELAAGRTMDSAVTDAAVRLLRSADARVRSRAAILLSQLSISSALPGVAEALAVERDPDAAAALLGVLVRSPDAAALHEVLRWLEKPETQSQAIDAAHAFHRAGLLTAEDARAAVLTALRSIDPARLTTSGVRLLAVLGGRKDRDQVATVLESGAPQVRVAAAEALVDFADYVDVLLKHASTNPLLFAAAVRSVATWRGSVSGLQAISELPAPSPQEHLNGLLRVGSALPMVDLLTVATSSQTDLALREALLARVIDRPMGPFLPGEEEDMATLGECILLLAETRLALRRPDLALMAIEALPPTWPGTTSPRAQRLRVITLLWTNRLTAAAQVDAPVEAWIDALELAIAEAHAPAILRALLSRFSQDLTPQEHRRLEALALRLPQPAANGMESPPPVDVRRDQ